MGQEERNQGFFEDAFARCMGREDLKEEEPEYFLEGENSLTQITGKVLAETDPGLEKGQSIRDGFLRDLTAIERELEHHRRTSLKRWD